MATVTLNNLIDEQTGQTNRAVLRGLVHRRAMADYGAMTPRSLRLIPALLRMPPGPASVRLAHTARRSSSDGRDHGLWRAT